MRTIMSFFLMLSFFYVFSQQPATNYNDIEKGLQQKQQLAKSSLVKNLPFKSIGPSVMGGRVTAIKVNPKNSIEFYIGYASGGVWYSNNNGMSFIPILDTSPTQNVGSLAVDWNTKTIWVGTGEVNSSKSSYAGIGLLKSTNQGKTWENMGLADSHHISAILINPNNVNELVVSVIGHLYSTNNERGIFKTTDGGKTWKKTLFISNKSGVIDLVSDPINFSLMYASSWERDRKAWNFKGSGTESAIYKSINAGTTWEKVTGIGSGFPTGKGVGRIGLAIYDKNTIYAIHDNQDRKKEDLKPENKKELTKDELKKMTLNQFLILNDKKLNNYLRSNNFPENYTATKVKKSVKKGIVKPIDLASYLEDTNTLLFNTPVIGAEVYKSTDGGKTWKKTHDGYLEDLYYSYGYYFGKINVDPANKDTIYIYGVPILKSNDGGKTFVSLNAKNMHLDHHDLWINPNKSGHLIDGNDGGLNISYDDGENWIKCNTPSVGQYYSVNIDHENPYNVYGGLQDNGVWVGAHTNTESAFWYQSGKYPFNFLMGGDGMQVQIDNRNSNIVYTGYQFGNYFRLNRETEEETYIQPKHKLGENPYRFNWQSPILLSSHNQDILYLGNNKLMRSMNQGDDWEAISGDLTKGGKKGNVTYGTLTSISESPFVFGLLYTGSDDGLINVSKNGGVNWMNISGTFPKDLWVSRIIASQHKKERVYVTLNGYRWDNFSPYVYVSENYGATWKSISNKLPLSSVNVIREDPKNENLLYLGTDNGVYVSLDRGESWQAFLEGLPSVAVHDLVIQPEANDLVLGTHGRSIYVANISILQDLNKDELTISEIKTIHYSSMWGSSFNKWKNVFEPKVSIRFYNPTTEKVTLSIKSNDKTILNSYVINAEKGVNVFEYDITLSEKGKKALLKKDILISEAKNKKYYLPKGEYQIYIGNKKTLLNIK